MFQEKIWDFLIADDCPTEVSQTIDLYSFLLNVFSCIRWI